MKECAVVTFQVQEEIQVGRWVWGDVSLPVLSYYILLPWSAWGLVVMGLGMNVLNH